MLLRNVGIDGFRLQGCAPPLITQAGHVFRQRGGGRVALLAHFRPCAVRILMTWPVTYVY